VGGSEELSLLALLVRMGSGLFDELRLLALMFLALWWLRFLAAIHGLLVSLLAVSIASVRAKACVPGLAVESAAFLSSRWWVC